MGKSPPDRAQDDQVHAGDREQEKRGNHGCNHATDFLESAKLRQRAGRHRNDDRCYGNDSGMPDREPESDRNRTLPVLHQLAGHIVDRRNMIGINRVTQAQPPGKHGGAEHQRLCMKQAECPDPDANVGGDQSGRQGTNSSAQRQGRQCLREGHDWLGD